MSGDNISQSMGRKGRAIFFGIVLLSLLLTACEKTQPPKTFTIGVVSYVSVLNPVIEGFKTGMADLGYIEGENVIYIYNGVVDPNPQAVDTEIENLLAQDIDLLFPVGNLATLRAKQAVAGTKMPVAFGAVSRPVEEGIVESISHPGGNLTGTQAGNQLPKALDLLTTITPEAKKVYVPYNPNDDASIATLAGLDNVPSQLGIELVLDEVHSVEEAVAAIENLPEDIDAIFRIPSPTLDPRNSELSRVAIARGLPMGTIVPLDEAVLVTLAADLSGTGKQMARLAHQIRQGAKPAELPVETAEVFLTINLKTAETIGLNISDEVLLQADIIIR